MLKKISLLLILSSLSFSSFAINKVIYGQDDRKDLYEVRNEMHRTLAKSTAAMIPKADLDFTRNGVKISGDTLEEMGICKDARYAEQITAASCSGFLIAKDIIVTAGHCVRSENDCRKYAWVFDYALTNKKQTHFKVEKDSVYNCKKIISQNLDNYTKDDYAVIRLDREVTNREPLKVRTEGKISNKQEILVIGHPTGLPTKIAGGAKVRKNNKSVFFIANLDTFGGNSGSAVFNAETGTVEGILVRGESDYVLRNGCRTPKLCKNHACRGEDVTRITNIPNLADLVNE